MAHTARYFGGLLTRFHFRLIDQRWTPGRHGARDCALLYESASGRLLFGEDDGATYCMLAAVGTPLPDEDRARLGQGETGWYDAELLVEFQSGRRIARRRVTRRIWEGSLVHFEWLSGLVDQRAEALFDLLRPGVPQTWHHEFLAFHEARRRRERWEERLLPGAWMNPLPRRDGGGRILWR